MPLGVLFFNENKVAEMAQILDCLHKYVPSQAMEKVFTLPDGTKISRGDYHHVPVLLGGEGLVEHKQSGQVMTMQQNVLVALYQ